MCVHCPGSSPLPGPELFASESDSRYATQTPLPAPALSTCRHTNTHAVRHRHTRIKSFKLVVLVSYSVSGEWHLLQHMVLSLFPQRRVSVQHLSDWSSPLLRCPSVSSAGQIFSLSVSLCPFGVCRRPPASLWAVPPCTPAAPAKLDSVQEGGKHGWRWATWHSWDCRIVLPINI